MKYKILVTGNNASVINDLFLHKDTSLDFITTSTKYEDMRNHVKYIQPDLVLYCMGDNNGASASNGSIANLRKDILNGKTPFAIVCETPEKGFKYSDFPGGTPNLLLFRPITATEINARILKYLENPEEEKIVDPSSIDYEYDTLKGNAVKVSPNTAELLALVDAELESIEKEKMGLGQKKILVIDDAPNMLKLIKDLLDSRYEVATAVSGKVAMKFLAKKAVDLILLDYEMPEEDGPTVLQQIRTIPELENTPVIFLTGINDMSKIQKALSLKPQGYLLKPIEQKKLLDRIQELIG